MNNPVNDLKSVKIMHRKVFLPFVFAFLASAPALFSQSLASMPSFTAKGVETKITDLPEIQQDDWTIYADETNRVYYIDFESLRVNISDVILKNAAGDVVFKEKVFDLPVNTIYELDLTKYQAGKYEIELRSFTGLIRKSVELK